MKSDFKIRVHQNSDNLHLNLLGDFDGSSAHELVYVLEKVCAKANYIIVHTCDLKQVHPFGREALQADLHSLDNRFFGSLIFTGENATKIAPDGSKVLQVI